MTLECAQGIFDLPANFTIDVKHTNPFLLEVGDMSAPITLPPTPNNLELVGNSYRLDALHKPTTKVEIVITEGAFSEKGEFLIDSVSRTNGISGTIFFGIATFYAQIDTRMLNSIDLPEELFSGLSGDLNNRRLQILNICWQEYREPTDEAPYYMAILNTDTPIKWVYEDGSEYERFMVINDLSPSTENFWGRHKRQYKEGEALITVDISYGVSPQLKLCYLLRALFESFGFSLDDSAIRSKNKYYPQWIVVNNVADAIYGGKCNPKQLIPEVSIKSFIAYIESILNGKFIVDDFNKKVVFSFFDDVLLSAPDLDLSDYVCSELEIEKVNFVEIVINDQVAESDNVRKIDIYIPDSKDLRTPRATIRSALCVSGVQHPNSEVRIQGKEKTKKESGRNDSITIGLANRFSISRRPVTFVDHIDTFRWGTAAPDDSMGMQNWIIARYTHRKAWELNSNILIQLKMNIPLSILAMLNVAMPKMIQGQPFFIESIERVVGAPKLMNVKLRTIRNFV